jgi:small subunit ribosomal protein S13
MAEKEKVPKEKPAAKKEEGVKEQIIRVAETNLDGNKPVRIAIRRVKGVGHMLSNAIAQMSDFSDKKLGDLSDSEMKRLEELLMNVEKLNLPAWLLNRRREPVTNQDNHLIVSNLDFTIKMNINEMKKIKSYRGVRHAAGLPVRGQRTRSSFRTGKIVGVSRASRKKTR